LVTQSGEDGQKSRWDIRIEPNISVRGAAIKQVIVRSRQVTDIAMERMGRPRAGELLAAPTAGMRANSALKNRIGKR
jgi:hypothetical protein